ncbi:MAG: arsenite efflux transporter metallochaperone ArsD [Bacillota bacterium]|nr:arsenite efflux transporter metallochaperone ArsD [Bacillota bacterium]MDP4160540.1 arsenite efflux transporter metallochaperone ArsD [Bacillota bacterium]
MKKMQIFEPAMCCPTGLCGVGVDPELLRISTVLNALKKHGIEVDRFNLTSAPMEFVNNKAINDLLNTKGIDDLPAIVLDGEILLTGRYPTNEEFTKILDIPMSFLNEPPNPFNMIQPDGGCC